MKRTQPERVVPMGAAAPDAGGGPPPRELPAEFDRAYKELVRLARAAALRTVGYQRADDIAQSIGIKFWKRWQEDPGVADPSQPLGRYVARAVRREIRDLYRSERRALEYHGEYEGQRAETVHTWMDPHEAQSMAELAGVIQLAIDDMPERMRDTFRRVREGEESYRVVAAEQGVKERTVATQMVRANQVIRAAVFEYWKEGA